MLKNYTSAGNVAREKDISRKNRPLTADRRVRSLPVGPPTRTCGGAGESIFNIRSCNGVGVGDVPQARDDFYYLNFLPLSLCLTFLLLLLSPLIAHGQESTITASVNRTHFTTDELVILTVTVTDDSPLQPRPILPRLDGLAVVDLDIATNVSLVNGKIHTEVTYTYRLQPRRTGPLTIPPVTVKIDGEIFRATPLSIEVSPGAPPAPSAGNAVKPANISPPPALKGQDLFIEAQVDQPKPYMGQQIIYTFRFYQAIQVYRQPQLDGPLFTGFETMGLPVREYNLEVDGRIYLISEIRTALFPKNIGAITVGPARLMFPGNIYEEPVELYTEPVTVEVKPLPDNAPSQFNGAVGQFKIESSFSPQVAVVNQPSTFLVAVSGIGNIQTLPEPIWPDLAGWRMYDSLSSLTTETNEDGSMSGTRVFERLVVADQVGDFTIQPATFVYFDPIAAEYRTITSQPLTVKVIPAPTPEPAALATAAPAAPPVTALTATTPAPVSSAVDPGIVISPDTMQRFTLPVLGLLVIGLCGALPIAAALGAAGVWWWQQRRTPSTPKTGQLDNTLKRPRQSLHPSLATAMRGSDNNYKVVSLALQNYLSATLQTPVNGLTRTELARRLRQAGLDKGLIERLEACLAHSEMGRYGPPSDDAGWQLMAETEALLRDLDQALKVER
ncbi:MAG: protein BatD [Chloroflexi bacterium]|nr:protein BatD [Chloroflexota bacterium]